MTAQFGYLLNAMERAACEHKPAEHDYKGKRLAVLGYVSAIEAEADRMRAALIRLRDCDWTITLPDRMDAVRKIARDALAAEDKP